MTSEGCRQFDELCGLVAAGAAAPEEDRAFRNHLAEGCPACAGAHRDLMETAGWLPGAFPPVPPPPRGRARLLEAIETENRVAPGRTDVRSILPDVRSISPDVRSISPGRGRGPGWVWAAAGWGLAVALGLMLMIDTDKLSKKAERYAAELESV